MTAPDALPVLRRNAALTRQGGEDSRTYELSFSSEDDYQRWWGWESLGHGEGEVRMDWLNSGNAPFLKNHWNDVDDQVGVIESARIENQRGIAVVRLADEPSANVLKSKIDQQIVKNVSVGYRIFGMELTSSGEDGEHYRITDWQPMEVSAVAVPADQSVGFNRAPEQERTYPVTVTRSDDMTGKTPNAPTSGAPTDDTKTLAAQMAAYAKRYDEPAEDGSPGFNASALVAETLAEGGGMDELRAKVTAGLRAMQGAEEAEGDRIGRRPPGHAPMHRNQWPGDQPALMPFYRAVGLALATSKDAGNEFGSLRRSDFDGPEREMGLVLKENGRVHLPWRLLHEAVPEPGYKDARAVATAKRILASNVATTGGANMIAEELMTSAFIEVLRNASVFLGNGAVELPAEDGATMSIPRQTTAGTAGWGAENPSSDDPLTDLAFDAIELSPEEVFAHLEVTRKMLIQSPGIEDIIRMDFAMGLALALDGAIIAGSGSGNVPRGILSTTGIGTVNIATNGGALTWDHIVDLETAVAQDNALVEGGMFRYVTNSKVRGKLKKTLRHDNTDSKYLWDVDSPMTPINGYPAAVSNAVPGNLSKGNASGTLSALMFGNVRDILVGLWTGVDIETLSIPRRRKTLVSAFMDADVGVRHPEGWAAAVDVTT